MTSEQARRHRLQPPLDGRRALLTGASFCDAVAGLSGRGLRAESMVADVADHGRFAALIEVDGVVVFLASDASALMLDGGWTAT